MTPSKDTTPPRSPSEGRQRSLKPSPEAATPHLPTLLSEETEPEQSRQGQTADAASPPATSTWLHAAPKLQTRFRLLYLQQAPLPCAGRPLSAPGLVPSRVTPPRQACCWAALPAVGQPACFIPEGSFTQGGLAGAERLPSHVKSQLGASIARVGKTRNAVKVFSGRHDPSLGSA